MLGAHGNLCLAFILLGTVSHFIMFYTAPTDFANHLAVRPAPRGAAGDPKGGEPLWPQCDYFRNIAKKRQLQGSLTYAVFTTVDHTTMVFGQGPLSVKAHL